MIKYLIVSAVLASILLGGCGPGEGVGKATEQDKANIERLAREGVGAPKSAEEEGK